MNNNYYHISKVASIIKGEIKGSLNNNIIINELLTDSRQLIYPATTLFFAIKSKRNDGHNYIEELYNKGVRAFVVEKFNEENNFKDAVFIVVKNTLQALQEIAAFHRSRFNIPVIGITGSNGKTIVKEWLYQLLCEDYNIVKSPKSYNSQIGVPLSIWQMNEEHNLAIFEAGISEPHEMDNLQNMIKPTLGIFTNIGQAHSANFINNSQKVGEKLKLFKQVETLIYCADYFDIQERIIKTELNKNIGLFTWSKNHPANLKIKNITKTGFSTIITGLYDNKNYEIKIPFLDNASIENAIHCWSAMLRLGYNNDIISQRMKHLVAIEMRLELKEGINNSSIINDSYNSDINSLAIALDFLNQQKQHKNKTVILSDILQSGKSDEELYTEVAALCKEKGVKKIIGIGSAIINYKHLFEIENEFYPDTETFLNNLKLNDFKNQSILLKGSRIYEFERISNVLEQKVHQTVLEINLSAIINNLNYFRGLLKPDTKVMAMVKAFSYGSGSFEIANALQFHKVDYLAVAYADEGVELRKAGINLPIMVMNPEEESFVAMFKYKLEPEIYSFRILSILEKSLYIQQVDEIVPIHIKLDTGMHRLGFEENDIEKLIELLKNNTKLKIASVFSHLAAADDKTHDNFTLSQIDKFDRLSNKIINNFNYLILRHILNSAGIHRFPQAQYDMVRLGIGLYGVHYNEQEQFKLQNVSKLKSCISQIKEIPANTSIGYNRSFIAKDNMKIAVIPIGYADGLSRTLSNGKGKVLIKGKFAPIVGNICMDMCMVDITNINCNEGDEVIIFGEDYPIIEFAKTLGTIPYEVLTSISRRVKRIYYQE